MTRYITEKGVTYRIRVQESAKRLREMYVNFMAKYPDTRLTFARYLVERGKVYNRVKQNA